MAACLNKPRTVERTRTISKFYGDSNRLEIFKQQVKNNIKVAALSDEESLEFVPNYLGLSVRDKAEAARADKRKTHTHLATHLNLQ